MLYRRHVLSNLALANAAMLPLLALAWIRLGPWEPLAWLGGLLMVDWHIVSRWVSVRLNVRGVTTSPPPGGRWSCCMFPIAGGCWGETVLANNRTQKEVERFPKMGALSRP